MKTIACYIHGIVEGFLIDDVLLRYKCRNCLEIEQINDEKEFIKSED